MFSPQPSQLSKPILLLLHCLGQSDLSRFVWTQEFFSSVDVLSRQCVLPRECSCTAGAAFIFAGTLSVYESCRYCTPWRELGELCRLRAITNKHCILLHNGNQRVLYQLTSWLYRVSFPSIMKLNLHKVKLKTKVKV